MQVTYIKNLDALRAFAALGVITAHAYVVEIAPNFPWLEKVAYLGNFGVSLFFVLSGFVITRILFKSIEGKNYFKSFYIRRLLRIFPLYYLGLIAYYFVPYLIGLRDSIAPFSDQAYFYLYLQNVTRTFGMSVQGPGHYWSLAVEEHFYLIWPAIVFLCWRFKPSSLLWVSGLLVLGAHILRYFLFNAGYDINVFTFTRLDQLVFGSMIAYLELKGQLTKQKAPYFLLAFVFGILLVGILEVANVETLKEYFKYSVFGIAFSGLICYVAVLPDHNWISKILQSRILLYFGKISYGLYVWHILSLDIVHAYFTGSPLVEFILVFVVTIVIASVSFYAYENQFLKLKKKFDY